MSQDHHAMFRYADITRDSFHPDRRFHRVILQQGRALLDADFNEQTSITLHLLRVLNQDLHGPHWGPQTKGFQIQRSTTSSDSLILSKGHYYVAGFPCENPREYPVDKATDGSKPYLAYLDVWERHCTPYEMPDPAMGDTGTFDPFVQDPALGHLDTTTRSRIAWRVRTLALDANAELIKDAGKGLVLLSEYTEFQNVLTSAKVLRSDDDDASYGRLAAGVKGDRFDDPPTTTSPAPKADPCAINPEHGYQGPDNQLFHVEVYSVNPTAETPTLTFKWARDNASAIFPVRQITKIEQSPQVMVKLWTLGRDTVSGLKVGDWVELEDNGDEGDHPESPFPFYKVITVDRHLLTATLKPALLENPPASTRKPPDGSLFFLRRWERPLVTIKKGDVPIQKPLCDGVTVAFKDIEKLRPGDYWQVPARALTGDVIWPRTDNGLRRRYLRPVGVRHFYAPLAVVNPGAGTTPLDLRRIFDPYPDGNIGVTRIM